jgi:4-aminobutyrate aminotransferase-like enzyme
VGACAVCGSAGGVVNPPQLQLTSATRLPRAQSSEKQYVLQTYARPKIVFTRGKGCVLYDVDGAPALVAAMWALNQPP